jgi:CBS domain-containing protein
MSIQAILYNKGSNVVTVSPAASVKMAADRLSERKIAALVVTEGDSILGVVSEREIVRALSRQGAAVGAMTVRDIMSPELVTVTPEDSLKRAMSLMTRHRKRHLPVLKEGRLAGIVSLGDVVKHRLEDLELETNVLRDAYIAVH